MHDSKQPPPSRSPFLWIIPLFVALAAGGAWLLHSPEARAEADIVVYKSPSCGCCSGWVKHLEQNGFSVETKNSDDMDAVKRRLGVPESMGSCHTGLLGGYVVEGHVPAADLRRLLQEKPAVHGIAAPGMPVGSPGMEVPDTKPDPYDVVTFTKDGRSQVFSRH